MTTIHSTQMSSIDVFDNYFNMLALWKQQNPIKSNTQSMLADSIDFEDQECSESTSNNTGSDNHDLRCGTANVSPFNQFHSALKENGYDIRHVLNLTDESVSRKIKCFCEQEFQNVLDLVSHLKFCERSKDFNWNHFNSETYEALDLTKRPEEVADVERVKEPCPECKFICSDKTSLLDHFDSDHKENGSYSCTCGHNCDWLPTFLRHYILCNVAATDLQEDRKEDSSNRMNVSFVESFSQLYNYRWGLPFGMLPTVPHQLFNSWLDKKDPESYHKCHWCDRVFSSSLDAASHLVSCSLRPSMKPFDPPFGIEFSKSRNHSYDHHKAMTSTTMPEAPRHFKCSHCIKSFKSKALLDQHMHIHYPPKYTCRYCSKKYRWPPVFYHHQRTCKKRPVTTTSTVVSASGVSTSTTSAAPSTVSTSLNSHIHQYPPHNKSSPNFQITGSSPYISNPMLNFIPKPPFPTLFPVTSSMSCICGHRMENFPSYLSHTSCCPMFLHVNSKPHDNPPSPMSCQMNPIQFPFLHTNVSLPPHNYLSDAFSPNLKSQHALTPSIGNFESSRLHVLGSPPFVSTINAQHYHCGVGKSCSQCGKEFSSRLSLKQHIEGKHSAEGKYQCPSCSKRYRWGASYYYHKKSCLASKESRVSPNLSPTMTEIMFD